MAIFYPTLETISRFKVQPTAGERTLLGFLYNNLDDSYEVYFNPYLNGDRPDVIIMRKGHGVMVIEVKDWNLDYFDINEKKHWIYKPTSSRIGKSPIDQVLKYKNNLFDLHVENLLEMKIKDYRYFRAVSCAVYFHCSSQSALTAKLIEPFKNDRKYLDFLKKNVDLIGDDSLNINAFSKILWTRYISRNEQSLFFSDTIYNKFKSILSPSIHLINQGIPFEYSKKQLRLIFSTTLEQRVKGVYGSGKTTALAARAVQAYKRALQRNSYPRILILTYNITLKNFIKDKINSVREEFKPECFVIINYHQFINAELNNMGINIEFPKNLPSEEVDKYLELNYYGNIQLFQQYKHLIRKYDAVFIDEIQDYHRKWMEIIKNYFRDPEGDYVLFGDVKQNIYGNPTEKKDVVTNVQGCNELKECFRSDLKVKDLAKSYQQNIFADKYEIDEFIDDDFDNALNLVFKKDGYVNYMYLENKNSISALYNIIRGNIENKDRNISRNDITILFFTTAKLRLFDAYYRYSCREKTNSMAETLEAMYMTHLNYIAKEKVESVGWFSNILNQFKAKLFPNRRYGLSNDDLVKLRINIAILFSLYDLYIDYPIIFKNRLSEECYKCGISLDAYLAYRDFYKEELKSFKDEVYSGNYKNIRDNKKLHFWMNSGTIKLSTINSFKGWESEVLFVVLEERYKKDNTFNANFDELLYTGLTRCRKNLVVINFGNEEYDKKIRPLVESIK